VRGLGTKVVKAARRGTVAKGARSVEGSQRPARQLFWQDSIAMRFMGRASQPRA